MPSHFFFGLVGTMVLTNADPIIIKIILIGPYPPLTLLICCALLAAFFFGLELRVTRTNEMEL